MRHSNWTKQELRHILRPMFGRFLACIALLTGLAAVGTPANASIAEKIDCEIGVIFDAAKDTAEDAGSCQHDRADEASKGEDKAKKPVRRRGPLLRPPVLYGADRAYE